MKLRVEIEIGNNAMLDAWDLCEALRNIDIRPIAPFEGGSAYIWDRNGNTVGHWRISEV